MHLIDLFNELGLKTYSHRAEDANYLRFWKKLHRQMGEENEKSAYASYIVQILTKHISQQAKSEKTNSAPIEMKFQPKSVFSLTNADEFPPLPLTNAVLIHLSDSYYQFLRHAHFSTLPGIAQEDSFYHKMLTNTGKVEASTGDDDNPWLWRTSESYQQNRMSKLATSFRITANVNCTPEWVDAMDAFAEKYGAKYKSPVDCHTTNRIDTLNVYFATPEKKPTPEMINDFVRIMSPYIRKENNERLIGGKIAEGIHWSPEHISTAEKKRFDAEVNKQFIPLDTSTGFPRAREASRLHFFGKCTDPQRSAAQIEVMYQIKELLEGVVLEQPISPRGKEMVAPPIPAVRGLTLPKTPKPAGLAGIGVKAGGKTPVMSPKTAYQAMMDALYTPNKTPAELERMSSWLNFGSEINAQGFKTKTARSTGETGARLLEAAVEHGHVGVVANLMKQGANPTLLTGSFGNTQAGETIFHLAADNIYDSAVMNQMVKQLLTYSDKKAVQALLNRPNASGITPVTYAILFNPRNTEVFMRYGGKYQSNAELSAYFKKFPEQKKQYDSYMRKHSIASSFKSTKSYA